MKYMDQMTEKEKKMIRRKPFLSRLIAARGYILLGMSSQVRCFAV